MKPNIEEIIGHEKILSIFGKWPSFHDAEVISINLNRGTEEQFPVPVMILLLQAFRLEVSPSDPTRNNCLISFKFTGIQKLQLGGFNHQNAINGIHIETHFADSLNRNVWIVKFLQGFGLNGEFQCDTMEIESVTPHSPKSCVWKSDE